MSTTTATATCWDWAAMGTDTFGSREQERRLVGVKLDAKHRWIRFDPQSFHGVCAAKGMRFSITLFSPRMFAKLSPDHFAELHRLGFPCRGFDPAAVDDKGDQSPVCPHDGCMAPSDASGDDSGTTEEILDVCAPAKTKDTNGCSTRYSKKASEVSGPIVLCGDEIPEVRNSSDLCTAETPEGHAPEELDEVSRYLVEELPEVHAPEVSKAGGPVMDENSDVPAGDVICAEEISGECADKRGNMGGDRVPAYRSHLKGGQ
eukprot:6492159-Amphidinium_carterae.2